MTNFKTLDDLGHTLKSKRLSFKESLTYTNVHPIIFYKSVHSLYFNRLQKLLK